jgi:hypothetical protein
MGGKNSRMVPAIVLFVVLLTSPLAVAWARTSGGEQVAGHPVVAGFRQSAEVDGETYTENEPVVLTYRVCRSRPWPTTTSSPGRVSEGSLVAEFRVLDDQGDVVADTSHRGYVLALSQSWWWPGQCRSVDLEWDQRFWNQPDSPEPDVAGSPVRGDRVEPGRYRFEVWWVTSRGDEHDEQVPEPIETARLLVEP